MLERIKEIIDLSGVQNARLFFIARIVKEGVNRRAPVLDKYKFKTYKVNTTGEVKDHLFSVFHNQLNKLISKGYEIEKFDIFNDDSKQILTYNIKNIGQSFQNVIKEQLSKSISLDQFEGVENFEKDEQLWAYCLGIFDSNHKWIYSFKKILKNKVVVDSKENPEKSKFTKFTRTHFNDSSNELEALHGETINLDHYIDCLFYEDEFYIFSKSNFEKITNLEEEYKQEAEKIIEEMKDNKTIKGANILKEILENNAKYHKKLVKIKSYGLYDRLGEKQIFQSINGVAKELKFKLKTEDDQFVVEDENDAEELIRFLCEYYKKSAVTNRYIVGYSGKALN